MRPLDILMLNPPYQTITSRFGVGHQVPLGLLMVGGALIDAGHRVRLLDAERRHLTPRTVAEAVRKLNPDVVMTGHAGSTPAHPVCVETLRHIKLASPAVRTVYGGVYPTYHAAEILRREPAVDFIIRGEGEATAVDLANALAAPTGSTIDQIPGLACRSRGRIVVTPDHPPIKNLDAFRVGWELIRNWDDYRCFGLGRAAIVQFSRGCPHRCTYCGQHAFWNQWRHRDPVKLAAEITWLADAHRIRFITLADENPTTHPALWRRLLEELAARRLPVHLFATIRATDIVRDAELGILPLYRDAGILYVLMGLESTSDDVLRRINKGSTTRHDMRACRLLKRHGIFSILGHVAGFEHETWASFRSTLRRLREYDGDYLNAMYVTPHDWTPFGREALSHCGQRIIERDKRKWDYRHQVLGQSRLRSWQLFAAVKWLELRFHLRPRRLWRILYETDVFRRHQYAWCSLHTGLVWLAEVAEFLARLVSRVIRRRATAPEVQSRPIGSNHPLPVLPVY